jgi:hypothetical protein
MRADRLLRMSEGDRIHLFVPVQDYAAQRAHRRMEAAIIRRRGE